MEGGGRTALDSPVSISVTMATESRSPSEVSITLPDDRPESNDTEPSIEPEGGRNPFESRLGMPAALSAIAVTNLSDSALNVIEMCNAGGGLAEDPKSTTGLITATTPSASERRSSFSMAEGRTRSRSVGERQWSHVRAVMAWYTRLRRIKKRSPTEDVQLRNLQPSSANAAMSTAGSPNAALALSIPASTKTPSPVKTPGAPHPPPDPSVIADRRSRSAQRWMKLRTTVQLTSAISSTIAQQTSKKQSLKREDSFIARFSTRQIPEAQETFDATDEGGSSSGGTGTGGVGGTCVPNMGGDKVTGANALAAGLKRRRRKKPPRSVLNPDENGLFYWLAFLALWVLYNLWTVVVRLAFPELHSDEYNLTVWNVCDLMGDVAYLLDVVVQFRTGYLEQGIMVHDSRKLALHYVRSKSFLIDMASMVPLDWLLLPQQLASRDPVLARWRPACRFLRLVKLYRVYAFYYVVESRTVYPNAWRVVNLVHILLMLAHWFGCFYFLLSESEGFHSDWSYPYPEGDFGTLTRKYLGSLYWSTLTLTTIGDLPTPETNLDRPRKRPQGFRQQYSYGPPAGWPSTCSNMSRNAGRDGRTCYYDDGLQALPRRGLKSRILHHSTNQGYIFTIASYLIGVFIFATIVGQVGNVITNRNASRLEFERLLDTAKLYMRHHKVPRSMQRRVQRWYDYSWSRGRIQGGGDTSSALRILPDKLKTELALHVNLATLKKVSIFKECQPEFLHDLVLKMRASIFTPGDMICRRGEVAREMFIIADGILEVISETGKVLTTMKSGDFFGEIGILNLDGLNKRTADVRSVGYAELFSLSREDVLTAMKDYPEAEEILLSLGRKRLVEARKAASQHRAQMTRKGLLALERQAQLRLGNETRDQACATGSSILLGGSAAQIPQQSTASRLSERIRSDVFGLKRAIRKSLKDSKRPKSSSPTKLEMGTYGALGSDGGMAKASSVPLRNSSSMTSSIGSSAGGSGLIRSGLLRRMAHVTSDEAAAHNTSSTEDCSRISQPLLLKQESPIEVIGAGLPLFQRLKLLRQKELEKERQQQQHQKEQAEMQEPLLGAPKRSSSTSGSVTTAVTVEQPEPTMAKSPPSSVVDKPIRHISFLDRKGSISTATVSDPTPPTPPPTGSNSKPPSVPTKTARWTLAVLPGRSGSKGAGTRARMLEVIQGSANESTSIEMQDLPNRAPTPPPPTPPPLPSSPHFWHTLSSNVSVTKAPPPLPPPPRPPLPALAALNRVRRGSKSKPSAPRRAMTLKNDSEGSYPEPPPRIWQHRGIQQHNSVGNKPQGGGAVPARRFSRQNTIQVVSDVQGVLTDILLDIVPFQPPPPPQPARPSATIDYGTMTSRESESSPLAGSPKDRPSRPKRLNLRQCKKSKAGDYNSIDDLSPEYTVLPFVKRLKILNERQKIVELQRALTVVGQPETDGQENELSLPSNDPQLNPWSSSTIATPSKAIKEGNASETNETPERVSLKNMLRTASRKELLLPQDQRQDRIAKLLRSQTVEGYAARHTNFTLLSGRAQNNNQHRIAQTLPSPPFRDNLVPSSIQPLVDPSQRVSTPVPPIEDRIQLNPFRQKQISFHKAKGSDGNKEECVAELLTAIKTVLQERLDEIQARFQAQIQVLQSEVDERDRLIDELRSQLNVGTITTTTSSRRVSSNNNPVLGEDGIVRRRSSAVSDEDEELDGPLRYFARSCSRDSIIQRSPVSPKTNTSPCPSVDEMLLNSASTEMDPNPSSTPLNPEPLWQLEFGSCWERMQESANSPVTSNPRDAILDLSHLITESGSSATESDSDVDPSTSSAGVLSIPSLKELGASPSSTVPYFPDWEIHMLAHQSLDLDSPPHPSTSGSESKRPLQRSATTATPSSSSRSKKMISKWYWSLPPTSSGGSSSEPEQQNPDAADPAAKKSDRRQ